MGVRVPPWAPPPFSEGKRRFFRNVADLNNLTLPPAVPINILVNSSARGSIGGSTMFAKIYRITKPREMWQVYWADPLRLVNGKPEVHREHFKLKEAAEKRQKEVNKNVIREGVAGMTFDAHLRADALAARQHLDAKGHFEMRLLTLAERYTEKVKSADADVSPIGPVVEEFLHDKEFVEERSAETVANLKTRLWKWINMANIATIGEVTRESVECLRTQKLDAQTKRNDMNAVSSFCSWLVSASPPRLAHHPLAGVQRPEPKAKKKPTFTVEECRRVLAAAKQHGYMATVAAMIFAGPRPSEVEHVRLIYGRHPLVRIEGGKLKGRANRTVQMPPPLRAFLHSVGNPERVPPLPRHFRKLISDSAAVTWKADVCRHTYISNRLQVVQNDGMVAREAGTSETVIYRHYHALQLPAEARKWAAIRPEHK
jgi:hypothetical protein